jgi:glycosyltransferase involved in cell wall biosynthesis
MTEYRIPLFEALRTVLAERGVLLDVLHGDPTDDELTKGDGGVLPLARKLPTRYALDGRLCWQPFGAQIRDADFVIVTQENKLIFNYWLLFHRPRARIAFWGHGKNMQSENPDGALERIKRWSTPRVDWWFAYTDISREFVLETGFPRERITVLNNAVDTSHLVALRQAVSPADIAQSRAALGLGLGPVGIYVGSVYREKRLDFLIEASRRVREKIPDFQLLVVGAGPDSERLRASTLADPWIHWAGVRQGIEKVTLLACSAVMLIPAAVGLGVLDSFALRVPLVTTDRRGHGPEIAYLRNGVNGMMSAFTVDDYATAVAGLLAYPDKLARLEAGCASSAALYTIEKMVTRFADGIESALAVEDVRQ